MKSVLLMPLALVLAAAVTGPRLSRGTIANVETKIDRGVVALDAVEGGSLLGATRGVYLDGYGTVFSTEVDLLPSAAPNPFRQPTTKADITRIKTAKQLRIVILRQKMKEAMVAAAVALDSVPVNERIAYSVTIPYYNFEDTAQMPRQIVMNAPRAALLQASRGESRALESVLQVQDY